MIMNSKADNKYHFLVDKPMGEDLFISKSQTKMAEIISENVINNPEFKIIGIDGDWGTGKSNLVELIKKKLQGTHEFFIYDVWGHQEDHQRQAILVELTRFINEKRLVKDSEKWEKSLHELLAKKKIIDSTSMPKLNPYFLLFLLVTIMYAPIVISLGEKMKPLYLKALLYLSPIIIVTALLIVSFCRNRSKNKSFKKNLYNSFSKVSGIYSDKIEKEIKHEVISENEPSAKEFQDWMDKIDNDLGDKNKKVIMVFDNFDRLPKQHILSIWSSIHLFFAERTYSNIKVILPFDKEHIQNAFNDLNDNKNRFGDDYINKTFDIVFRIPKPIMSDWKDFFRKKWEEAFSGDIQELESVIHIYEHLSERKTPREIISFINEILTIKLVNNVYKERYIAIFVLCKSEVLKDTLKSITDLNYLKGLESIYKYDNDFSNQLTAITYNLEVDKANEIIYLQNLIDSLNKNDLKSFETISKAPFFKDIFDTAINQIKLIENPIRLLGKLIKEDFSHNFNSAWKIIYDKALMQDLKFEKINIEDWQLILIKNAPNNDLLKRIINECYYLLTQKECPVDLIEQIDKLPELINGESIYDFLKNVKVEPERFLEILNLKGAEYLKYKVLCEEDKLDDYLKSLQPVELEGFSNTDVLFNYYKLTDYVNNLKQFIRKYDTITEFNVTLTKLKESSYDNYKIKELINDSQLITLFKSIRDKDDIPIKYDLIAFRLIKANKFSSSYSDAFSSTIQSNDKTLVNGVSKVILDYINYKDLLLLVNSFGIKAPLLKAVVLKIIEANYFEEESFEITEIIKSSNYSKLKSILEIKAKKLLNNLSLGKFDFNDSFAGLDSNFIEDCFSIKSDDYLVVNSFKRMFNSNFSEFRREEYENIFDDFNSIYVKYFNEIEESYLTQSSLDVFGEKFKNALAENNLNDKWWEILEIYNSAKGLSIKQLLENIRDDFLNSKIELTIDNAEKITGYFLKFKLLKNKDSVFRTIIKNEFLENEEYVTFLLKNVSYINNIYDNLKQEDRQGFENTINANRDSNELIEELAKKIGIRKSSNESEEK